MVEEDKQAMQRQLLHHLPRADGMPSTLQVTTLEEEKSLALVFVFLLPGMMFHKMGHPFY